MLPIMHIVIIENHPKIHPKWMKIIPKNEANIFKTSMKKSTTNLSKIDQQSTKNGPPEGPGRPLGGSRRPLGPSWNEFESQDGSKVDLGALLGGVWEVSWAVLKRNWGPRWFQVGSQEGGFWDPKTKRKWMHYWEPLGVDIFMDFGSILASKMKPSWHQIEVQHR